MGLLDSLSNLDETQTQGLLAAASQMLQNSGPSRSPVGFGQIVGSGLEAYQGSTLAAKRRKMEEERAALEAKMYGMKIRDSESDFKAQEAKREYDTNLRNYLGKMPGSAAPSQPMAQAPQLSSAPQASYPGMPAQMSAPPAAADPFQQRMARAEYLRTGGFHGEADAAELDALKFQKKVKTLEKVRVGNRVLLKPYFEDGSHGEPVDAEVAEKLNFQDTGGKTLGLNAFTGAVEASHANTQSPNNVATVGAAYAQANATKEIAKATRNAAEIRRDQETEMKLGDDYRTQSKSFKEVGDAYRTINATLDKATMSPAATLAGATKFMKLLDPGSVVRESELGMALAASGVFDRATNYHNTLLRGKVLTPNQVADFKNITTQIYGAAQQGQQAIDKSYRSQAEKYGLRPDMVVQDLGQNQSATPVRKFNPKTGKIE